MWNSHKSWTMLWVNMLKGKIMLSWGYIWHIIKYSEHVQALKVYEDFTKQVIDTE